MHLSRVTRIALLTAVLFAIALPWVKSFPVEGVQPDETTLDSDARRREHLRASLCASFYLQERGQRLPRNPEVRRERCGCLANCRDRLRLRFLEGPSMRAAYYGALNTDILRISNSHLPPPGFLPSIRRVADSLSEGSDEAKEALGKIIKAAVACVDEISLDRKVDVQSLKPSLESLQGFQKLQATQHDQQEMSGEGSASPQILRAPSGLLGDPYQMRQWYLHSFFGNFTVEADKAWQKIERATKAIPVVLAVLDTGCYLHQDFIDDFDVASSIFWDNPGEKDCTDGIDDDENGYIDDCFGWNFVEDNGHPFTDDSGHGTLVTSVAAARAHDGRGGRGVFSNPTVMCLRVGSRRGVWTSTTIPALDYAVKMKARVSNHSYGGPGFVAAEYEAFVRALKHDHLIVTAAGNSGCNIDEHEGFTPGAFRLRGLVNVMASDVAGFRASFSNYGSYTYVDGTSFAAPIVAGMAASLWAYFESTTPPGWHQCDEPASRKVEQAIMYSVTGSKALAGAVGTNGVVNMWRAMSYFDTVPGPFTPEYPTPERGYDPNFTGGESQLAPSLLLPLMWILCATALHILWST
ncbi:subtilase family serine protease, putative [Eimeria praecox]|uniref:subtilisin n=1 Tax=Eimeria praecox TaxID=51316 RepID=U6GSY3_9EIME|nr:subtilase family serine protease, putative [Eimeria praecox]